MSRLSSTFSTLTITLRNPSLGDLTLVEPEKIPCALKLAEGCLNFVITLEKEKNKENENPNKLPEVPKYCENCGELSKSRNSNFISSFGISNDFSSKRESATDVNWTVRDKCNRQKSEIKRKLNELENFEETETASEYIERIAKDIFSNIEENYEIKASLTEIEDLMRSNLTKMRLLEQRILNEFDAIELSSMEDELETMRDVHSENQEIHEKLHSALKVNQNQKDILSDLLIKFSEENRLTARQTEISLFKLQLANVELSAANHELLSEIHSKSKRVSELEYMTSPASTYLQSNSSLLFKSESRSKPNSGIKLEEPIEKKKQIFSGGGDIEQEKSNRDFRRNEVKSQEIKCRARETCVKDPDFEEPKKDTSNLPSDLLSSEEHPIQPKPHIESFVEGEGIQLESDSPTLTKTSRALYQETSPSKLISLHKPKELISMSEEECVMVDSSIEDMMR